MMDKKLIDVLACPVCKGKLAYDRKNNELTCRFDKLAFPIREDIPVMLVDEARRLTPEELS